MAQDQLFLIAPWRDQPSQTKEPPAEENAADVAE